jgi:hypothetical protein
MDGDDSILSVLRDADADGGIMSNVTDLERLQRIAADIRAITTERWPRVQLGVDNAEAMALLERLGAREAVHNYDDRPSIRNLTLEIGGVSFAAQGKAAKANPFDGHTVEPWDEDSELWSIDGDGGHYLLGLIDEDGWSAWLPLVASELERGPETGDEGRRLTEDALIKAGATIPWREGNP